MAYRIVAIDVHKKMLAVVVADVAGEGEYEFERRKFGATPINCTCWPNGWSSRRLRKWSWNRPRSTGSRYGARWNGTNRRVRSGTERPKCPAHHICAKPNPTAAAWAEE